MDSSLTIALVEDHEGLRNITAEALAGQGHAVIAVDSAESLQEVLGHRSIDLLVVDVNLPGEDGISLTRRLKQSDPDLGVIMTSVRNQLHEKLGGYDGGADIYLPKPTSAEELCAAVGALGKRLQRSARAVDEFRLDLKSMRLGGPSGDAQLTTQDVTVLAALVRAPGQRLETWQLLEPLGWLDEPSKPALEVPISRLRQKFKAVGATINPIVAVRKFGYQLACQVRIYRTDIVAA